MGDAGSGPTESTSLTLRCNVDEALITVLAEGLTSRMVSILIFMRNNENDSCECRSPTLISSCAVLGYVDFFLIRQTNVPDANEVSAFALRFRVMEGLLGLVIVAVTVKVGLCLRVIQRVGRSLRHLKKILRQVFERVKDPGEARDGLAALVFFINCTVSNLMKLASVVKKRIGARDRSGESIAVSALSFRLNSRYPVISSPCSLGFS